MKAPVTAGQEYRAVDDLCERLDLTALDAIGDGVRIIDSDVLAVPDEAAEYCEKVQTGALEASGEEISAGEHAGTYHLNKDHYADEGLWRISAVMCDANLVATVAALVTPELEGELREPLVAVLGDTFRALRG